MHIETIGLDEVRPYERNPRKHSDLQVREMAKSIERFGQIRPAVIDENGIILAGHGIRLALILLGRTTIDVLRKTGLSETEKKKLVLADNKLAELGADDYDQIMKLIGELDDFEIPGYDPKVLDDLLRSAEKALDDYGTLPIPAETVTSNFFKEPEPAAEPTRSPQPKATAPDPVIEERLDRVETAVKICPNCGGEVPL